MRFYKEVCLFFILTFFNFLLFPLVYAYEYSDVADHQDRLTSFFHFNTFPASLPNVRNLDGKESLQADVAQDNICKNAKPEGMHILSECSKRCKTACRFKKKVQGVSCYVCPSNMRETCWDAGALPKGHPWCRPGGVCYDDPMLYCMNVSVVAPKGSRLECMHCKRRADMCWQRFPNTSTYTNCKLSCSNGTCRYRGRYKEAEWDGKSEYIHCYECITPPPPPTCEDLGWGYDWEKDCLANCPLPGYCEEERKKIAGAGKKKGKKANGAGEDGAAGGAPGDKGAGGQDAGQAGEQGEGVASTEGIAGSEATQEVSKKGTQLAAGRHNVPSGEVLQQSVGGKVFNSGKQVVSGAASAQGRADKIGQLSKGTGEVNRPDIGRQTSSTAPTTPQIVFYRSWLAKTEKRIREMETILSDPDTGDTIREVVSGFLDRYKKERDRLKAKIKDMETHEAERLRLEAEQQRRVAEYWRKKNEEYRRQKLRSEEAKRQKLRAKYEQLKSANSRLKIRAKQISESLANRRMRIQEYQHKIELARREIKHFQWCLKEGTLDEDFCKKQIADRKAQIADFSDSLNYLVRSYKKKEQEYKKELASLVRDYQKKLWAVDKGARRRSEVQRIDEYYETLQAFRRYQQMRKAAEKAFKSVIDNTTSQIVQAEAQGDEDTAERLRRELRNIKEGKKYWDRTHDSREAMYRRRLSDMEYRNSVDGVGPTSPDELADKLAEYAELVRKELNRVNKAIARLQSEVDTGSLIAVVDAQGNKVMPQLDALRERAEQLRSALEGIIERKRDVESGYKLTQSDAERVIRSAVMIAEASRDSEEEKSFARLFAESLGSEILHNVRPDVAFKKNVAFAWGMVQGVASAIKGLAEFGAGFSDLMYESYAQALGFEDGSVFGTDATDALMSVIDNYGSPEGLVKACMDAGEAIDKELTRIERSGDIDWYAAEAGGKIVGETVVADALVEGAVSRLGSLINRTDELIDIAKAAGRISDETEIMTRGDDLARLPKRMPETPESVARAKSVASGEKILTRPLDRPVSPRGPPKPAPLLDNTRPLPINRSKKIKPLSDDVLDALEMNNGFRKDHARAMNEFAQQTDTYLIVRNGNPDSVPRFSDPDAVPKPMSSKAKTAKVGEDVGFVVDPTHPRQKKFWDDEMAVAMLEGDMERLAWLEENYLKAYKTWQKYGKEMIDSGMFKVDDAGLVRIKVENPDGSIVWKKIHGDYDLHGVYKRNPDGTVSRVNFGNGLDVEDGAVLRKQLADKISKEKVYIQHGAQDDWIIDPHKFKNAIKPPDPPVTVFFPDGRPPKTLNTAEEMRKFYEQEMGIEFPYKDTQGLGPRTGLDSGTGSSQSPPASSVKVNIVR